MPYFKHMIRFLPHSIRKAKAVEYLQAPALQPVGLTIEDFGAAFVHDTRLAAEARHPGRRHEAMGSVSVVPCFRGHCPAYPAGPAPMISLQRRELAVSKR